MSENCFINKNVTVNNIPFYTNLTSIFSDSTYTFSSLESMKLFKKTGNKLHKSSSIQRLDDFKYIGIPLFQCQLKKDASYLLSKERSNLIIYKYIVLPFDENNDKRQQMMAEHLDNREYKFICNNEEHNISIYKVVFSEIKNEMALLSLSTSRTYTLKFRNDHIVMTFKNFHDYIEVENSVFPNAKWIYNDNVGNVIVDGFFINNNYKLISNDKLIVCEFDNTERSNKWITYTKSEYMGLLKLVNSIKPSNGKVQYHDNNFLNDFNEKIICMTFVLIAHKRFKKYEERKRRSRNGFNLRLMRDNSATL
ncbi:hypothetical protein HANVADRAFT_51516 [Hanseniaspora valbyensis NRRL Y-1626]|uniref:Uncharacterized protein n=1 Tax=Hanseniaspora valbyensis NRRL Y-1626 TaxID=766949 RepID=A0A1B7THG6_9ASCO|nr:hypothetical protein HANVADRAFT_51516 [Hanseniaspora valbyensis NRRL Y-1626]